MGRRIRVSPGWSLVAVVFMLGTGISFVLYTKMTQAELEWEQYQKAQSCPDKANCRRTLAATILQSQTWTSITRAPGRYGSGRTFFDTEYHFEVDSGNGPLSFSVSPQRPADQGQFGALDIYIPDARQVTFAEDNFPVGKQVRLEIWNNTVTFIFTDSIYGYAVPQDGSITLFPLTTPTADQQSMAPVPAPSQENIAIPTVNHPLIALSKAEQDLTGAILATVFINIALIVLIIRFSRS